MQILINKGHLLLDHQKDKGTGWLLSQANESSQAIGLVGWRENAWNRWNYDALPESQNDTQLGS